MSKFRILSLDGGPHGVNYLRCLRKIEEHNPGFLASVDLFAGSTFGGLCSLYFARHIGKLSAGESALDIIDGCIQYTNESTEFHPDEEAYSRLLGGRRSMYTNDNMREVLIRSENLGDARLCDLSRRVVVVSASGQAPWGPRLYDSANASDGDVLASEIALETVALPAVLPMRNGRLDGAFATINPCMFGLTQVLADGSAGSLDDVVLLTLGGDAGSSVTSNVLSPWNEDPFGHKPPAFPDTSDKDVKALITRVQDIRQQVQAKIHEFTDREQTLAKLGMHFKLEHPTLAALRAQASGDDRNTEWGNDQWLLYPFSPAFLYQVLVNNTGLTPAHQAKTLLGDRALRFAPISLLDSNVVLFFYFFVDLVELVWKNAQLTADLWSNPITGKMLKFSPSFGEVQGFVDQHWNS